MCVCAIQMLCMASKKINSFKNNQCSLVCIEQLASQAMFYLDLKIF